MERVVLIFNAMYRPPVWICLAACAILVGCDRRRQAEASPDPDVLTRIEFDIPLGTARDLSGEAMTFTVGIGSGAACRPGDPAGVVYAVTDRGPNLDAEDYFKKHRRDIDGDDAKVFPLPDYTPTIYKLRLKEGGVEVLERLPIRRPDGRPVSGLCMPGTEGAWSVKGDRLQNDPDGLDVEGIAVMPDGSFWISEEYAPSLVRLDARGVVRERWVPAGVAARLDDSHLPTVEKLPAIVGRRHLNRGIEGLAVDREGETLYFILQSPLDNPSKKAAKTSRHVRLYRVDLKEGKVDGEFLYVTDPVRTFADDDEKKQSKVKLSELSIDTEDRLVALERVDKTTRLYRLDLAEATNLLGTRWNDPDTGPSLEELDPNDLPAEGVTPVTKTLLFDSARLPKGDKLPEKVEAMAPLGPGRWLLINDNDFGIDGERTRLTILSME